MFPFRYIVRANDKTIKEFIRLANHFGYEGANWTFEWMDGGRAIFSFDTDERRTVFRVTAWFWQISGHTPQP
jgi:hypothetical protein